LPAGTRRLLQCVVPFGHAFPYTSFRLDQQEQLAIDLAALGADLIRPRGEPQPRPSGAAPWGLIEEGRLATLAAANAISRALQSLEGRPLPVLCGPRASQAVTLPWGDRRRGQRCGRRLSGEPAR